MKVFYDADANLDVLKDKQIAIIGYGSQGHAHANNLKDSGFNVVVGLREDSPSREKAKNSGLEVLRTQDAVAASDVVMMLVPDEIAPSIFKNEVAPFLRPNTYLMFAHGFGVHFKKIEPSENVNVFLVAPKGPGHLVRNEYIIGKGVPCLFAVHQDPAGDTR